MQWLAVCTDALAELADGASQSKQPSPIKGASVGSVEPLVAGGGGENEAKEAGALRGAKGDDGKGMTTEGLPSAAGHGHMSNQGTVPGSTTTTTTTTAAAHSNMRADMPGLTLGGPAAANGAPLSLPQRASHAPRCLCVCVLLLLLLQAQECTATC